MEACQFFKPPIVQGTGIGWQDNVYCFLGCRRCTANWLYASQGDYYRVYHADLLHKLRAAITQKRRGKLTRVLLLLHGNASAHRSHVGLATVLECVFEEMRHPPYSLHLAANDYHVFPNLKKRLRGQRFLNDEELKYATDKWLTGQ